MNRTASIDRASVQLRLARLSDLDELEPMVGAYHAFENIVSDPRTRRRALQPLLESAALGRVWLIDVAGTSVGYIALCFGYTLEFAGRDAFIDEFFIDAAERGRGLGTIVVERVALAARELSVRALHLEVARDNAAAAQLYGRAGFVGRDKYRLMTLDLSSRD